MTTTVAAKDFVDKVRREVIEPAKDQLMDSRYFRDLRAGTLTVRRLQGFSLQHYWFNMALLKGASLRILRAVDDDGPLLGALHGIVEEWTHPAMAKKFGLRLGLTEEDFKNNQPIREVMAHTGAVVSSAILLSSPAQRRTSGMVNESIVQRYSMEFQEYLRQPPYSMSDDDLEFFIVHGVVDIEHSGIAANQVAGMIRDDRDCELVWKMAEDMVAFKLAKFEGIYDRYV